MHGRSTRDAGAALRGAVAVAAALAAAMFGAPARADAVGYPPEVCPAGSEGAASHCGEYCSPHRCTNDDDCGGDMTCEPLDLCIEVLQCMSNGGPFTAEAVRDTCEGGAACAAGTCQSARVCASPEPDTSAQRFGCTCSAAGGGEAAGAAIMALIAAAATLGLRRRLQGVDNARER